MKDEEGKAYQSRGCGGFGKHNFSELFKFIEEYEKTWSQTTCGMNKKKNQLKDCN